MAKENENVAVKISICPNMSDDKIIILCSPKNKETVDNMLSMVEDKIEELGEIYGDNYPDISDENNESNDKNDK